MNETFDEFPERHGLPNPLPLPVPPNLANIFGYRGAARFVGFSHEPWGDEAYFDDGCVSGTGNVHALNRYRDHAAVAPHLALFHLGSSEEQSIHALIIDRNIAVATVLRWSEARPFLQSQHAEVGQQPADSESQHEDVSTAQQSPLSRPHTPPPEEIIRRLQEQQRVEIEMLAWLDQHLHSAE